MMGQLTDKGVADDGKMIARIDDVPFVCIPKTYPFLEKLERGYQVEYELDEENRIKKIWRAKKATAPKEDFTTADKMKKAGFNQPEKETMSDAEYYALKARGEEAAREKAHAEEMERINREAKEHQEKMAKENADRKANERVQEKIQSPCFGCSSNDKENDCGACQSMQVETIPPKVTHPAPKNYSDDEMLLLRHVIAKGCTDPEFRLLMYMANTYGLDPLLKQIWAVKRNEKDPAIIFAGRDGMLLIAHRSGQFDGIASGVIYEKDDKGKEHPVSAWCEIWRKDMTHSFKTEVRFSEYEQPIPQSGYRGLWQTKPSVMILKCAESVCLRKAFSITGIYSPEEIA